MEQQTKPKSQGKAKKKTDNRRGFNLKFTTAYWLMLEEMKKQCGFRSTYEMLITIIQCFVRYVAKRREQIRMEGEPRDGVTSEIEEMFADLEDSEPTPANTARTVTRHKPSERHLYGREDDGSTEDIAEDPDDYTSEDTSTEDNGEDPDEENDDQDESSEDTDEDIFDDGEDGGTGYFLDGGHAVKPRPHLCPCMSNLFDLRNFWKISSYEQLKICRKWTIKYLKVCT